MITPEAALKRLMDGNERFVRDRTEHPNLGMERRIATTVAQEPFAVILGCSDSRVPVEIVFDQGVGDLFVVRVAGSIAGPIEIESIEFAVQKLHTSIIVVLGHQNCGAVTAVLKSEMGPETSSIATLIEPAIEQSKHMHGDHLTNAIKTNVALTVSKLNQIPLLREAIAQKKLQIIGCFYDLSDGKVSIL